MGNLVKETYQPYLLWVHSLLPKVALNVGGCRFPCAEVWRTEDRLMVRGQPVFGFESGVILDAKALDKNKSEQPRQRPITNSRTESPLVSQPSASIPRKARRRSSTTLSFALPDYFLTITPP